MLKFSSAGKIYLFLFALRSQIFIHDFSRLDSAIVRLAIGLWGSHLAPQPRPLRMARIPSGDSACFSIRDLPESIQ